MSARRPLAFLAIASFAALPFMAPACTSGGSSSSSATVQSNAGVDWRDEVIYQAITDRFANGDVNNDFNLVPGSLAQYQGGDWKGLADHADYLNALGVTAVWISPVIKNVENDANVAGYHGYWTQDFTTTNPHFGDVNALVDMVTRLHAHGIKVIFDIVCNDIGQFFFYDINLNGVPDEALYGSGQPGSPVTRMTEYDPDWDANGIQAYNGGNALGLAPVIWRNEPTTNHMPIQPAEFQNPNWYHRKGRVVPDSNGNWPTQEVLLGDFPGGLKDLATERQDVRDALARVFGDWIKMVDFDGYRIDTLKHVEPSFWQDFCPRMRQTALAKGKQNFFMFGEAFDGDDGLVGSLTQTNMVDSAFYFPQKYVAIDGVIKGNQPTSNIEDLYNRKANYGQAPQPGGVGVAPAHMLVNFIDNHDVSRFLFNGGNGVDYTPHLKLALAYIFACEGVPCVYYGTEQGFSGAGDPANREVLWPSGYNTASPLFQHIAALTKVRRDHVSLRRGAVTVRWSTGRTGNEEDAGIFAMERIDPGETSLFVMNANPNQQSHSSYQGGDMQTSFPGGTILKDLTDATYTVTVAQGGTAVVNVPALGWRFLVPQ